MEVAVVGISCLDVKNVWGYIKINFDAASSSGKRENQNKSFTCDELTTLVLHISN